MNRSARSPALSGPFIGAPRFQLVRTLGAGGMGTVYEVFDTERRVRMALKSLNDRDAEAILHFKREFRALCDLRHPNLVSLGDLVEKGGEWFFTMELVEGTDFLTHVRPQIGATTGSLAASGESVTLTIPGGAAGGGFHEARLRAAFRQLATALVTLHRAGKLHRDLKPSNVMVTLAERVVVLDFGLVTDRSSSLNVSRDEVAGTVRYMAPEQALGGEVGPAADWYAFGTMLFEALTGRLPFDAKSPAELMVRKGREEAPSPLALASDAPDDLVALCRALLQADPRRRPDEATLRAAFGVDDDRSWVAVSGFGAPEHVFVGRGAELAALEAAFNRTTAGESVTIVVDGESGVGKSALVDAFVRQLRASRQDAVILRSRCREQEAVSYRAFDGWMDDLSRVLLRMDRARVMRIAPRHTAELLALFPCLAAVRGLTDAAARRRVDDEDRRESLGRATNDPRLHGFAAAIELLRNVAIRKPLVAVIDDLQWADDDSLLLLEDVLWPHHVPRWCLVVTERRGEGEEPCAARRLLRGDVRVLSLGGLAKEEARQLVSHLAEGRSALPSAAVDEAVEDSHGHPLFLSQLVSHLARARPSARGALTLDDALWAEIAALPPTASKILGVLAVAGSPVTLGALVAAVDVPPEVFVGELSGLRAARLARIHGSRRDDTAETYHNRVRETLLARLTPQDRRALHRALALALEATGAEDDRIALQWRYAEDEGRALVRAKRAIDLLEHGGAFGRAAEMVRLVLEVADPKGPERGYWLVRLGDDLGRAGRPKDAADAYVEAATAPLLSAEERVELERRATEQLLTGGLLDEGVALARKVLNEVGVAMPEGRWATAASTAWAMWRARSAVLHPPKADAERTSAQPREARYLRLDARWSAGSGLLMLDPTRGTALLAAGLRDALAHGDAARRARALCAATFAECANGALDHAERFADAAEREAGETGSVPARLYASLARAGIALMLRVDHGACLMALRQAEEGWRAVGGAWERAVIEQSMCTALFWTGDFRGYRQRRETALRDAHLGGHRYLEGVMRTLSPPALLLDDDPASARAEIERVERDAPDDRRDLTLVDYWCLEARTWIFFYAPRPEDVAPLEAGWRAFERSALGRVPLLSYPSALLRARFAYAATQVEERAGRVPEAVEWRRRASAWARQHDRLARTDAAHDRINPYEMRPAAALAAVDRAGAEHALRKSVAWNRKHGRLVTARAHQILLGEVIGGDEGRALVRDGHRWLQAQGVRNPEAFARAMRGGVTI